MVLQEAFNNMAQMATRKEERVGLKFMGKFWMSVLVCFSGTEANNE